MSSSVWGNEKTQFFNSLSPHKVLDAADLLHLKPTARVMQLTSMENRVYEVEVDNPNAKHVSENFVIMKFYRPGRWTKEQIQDEHDFLFDLIENDIQAIAPKKFNNDSIFTDENGLFFSVFPKQGGRACVEWNDDLLKQMGRLLARLHTTGKIQSADHRLKLNIKTFGQDNLDLILNSPHLLLEYKSRYKDICEEIFKTASPLFEGIQMQRIHGDCHHGNILLNEERPFLIDFDDMSVGPCVQDLWMITPGRDDYSLKQRDILIDAYLEMSDFNFKELKLIEVLRTLRIIHFSAWIGHRFEDEAFKRAFPHFGTSQYWEKEIFDLTTQLQYIQDDIKPSSYQY
jgi:Ser/Thr protein kinase RdoA (MazF antagonist)